MTRERFYCDNRYNTLNASRTAHVSGSTNQLPLVSRSCQHSSTTPRECDARQPISARRSHGRIPFIWMAAWSGKNEFKTLAEFSHATAGKWRIYIIRTAGAASHKEGRRKPRRTWKSHLEITLHLHIVRKRARQCETSSVLLRTKDAGW